MIYAATAKPAPPPVCDTCEDGRKAFDLPLSKRKGFKMGLRCPDCETLYAVKLSKIAIKRMSALELEAYLEDKTGSYE